MSVNGSNEPPPVPRSVFEFHHSCLWILPSKQSLQIVLRHSPFLAPLLKQEPGDGGLNQSVLIPFRVTIDETPHGVVQILR